MVVSQAKHFSFSERDQSGLLTHIAAMESVSLFAPVKGWVAAATSARFRGWCAH
jgi:hypothetical protein